MKFCNALYKIKLLKIFRPCISRQNHWPLGHTPDLCGLEFGALKVIRRAKNRIRPNGHRQARWVVRDKFLDTIRIIPAYALLSGESRGVKFYSRIKRGDPELTTAHNHLRAILKSSWWAHKYYKGMPIFSEWDPGRTPGAAKRAAHWIRQNLGKRPTCNWSLDIVDHAKGFVPGNLRWAKRNMQIGNQQHRFLGQISEDEFAVEARRRGWRK